MKIIYEDYTIEMDSYEYTLYDNKIIQEGDNKGKKKQHLVGHYSELISAIKKIIHLELARKKETVTIKDFLKQQKSLYNKLTEHFSIKNGSK